MRIVHLMLPCWIVSVGACSTSPRVAELAEARTDDRAAAPATPVAAFPPRLAVTATEVMARRSDAFVASDYYAEETTFRLFGVELGDGTSAPRAILADTRDWSTREVAQGALFGRGHRVTSAVEGRVVLTDAAGQPHALMPGHDAKLRVVSHRLDHVVRPLGRHAFALDREAARAARDTHPAPPVHEAVTIFGASMRKLGPLPSGSLLAEAGFRDGDLVAQIDGAPVGETGLTELVRRLADGAGAVRVRIYRGGAPQDRTFVPTSAP